LIVAERKAGSQLIGFLLHDPLGEEILEGTTGGLIAGASQLGSDQTAGEIALQTAAAIAGGIGLGMAGRRLGAAIGKRIQPRALEKQDSMVANLARMVGSETTAGGFRDQGAVTKSAIQEALVNETSSRLAREAMQDPAGFAKRYGVSADLFSRVMPSVQVGRTSAAAAEAIKAMPPEMRQQAMKKLADYELVENLITQKAAGGIDELIASVASTADQLGKDLDPGELEDLQSLLKGKGPGDALRSLLNPVPPITGEHVGRAMGRAIGDEVGVLGGLAVGSLLAQQLGMESPKDRRIRELEQQLKGGA
jgi:hypothetical protein